MHEAPNDKAATAPIRTPLYAAHIARGARMVPFAGYEMPVQYPAGILEEHAWTRTRAGLFDISHMGQARIVAADGSHETVAAALETLVPADLIGLAPGEQRYTQLLNPEGGTLDDLMVSRPHDAAGTLILVMNAARKAIDEQHLRDCLPRSVRPISEPDRALIALQGPRASTVIEHLAPETATLAFMQTATAELQGIECHLSRSGYTGEDGFEISVANRDAIALWQLLLTFDDVRPCGLGARDSLRLEAGLCLYGHELDETTSPIEAGLAWSIPKRRRTNGAFLGSDRVARELADGTRRRRVGMILGGRAPAREGAAILSAAGDAIGIVTSGGFSPTLKQPIAMGYVTPAFAAPKTPLKIVVRHNGLDAEVVPMPFVPHAYRRNA